MGEVGFDIGLYWNSFVAFFAIDGSRLLEPQMMARLILQGLLFCLSAFFSGSETALFALSRLDLQKLRKRAETVKVGGNIQYNPGWHLALDLENMLDISEVVTRAALERTESRGAHTREDYPDSDPEWAKLNLVARQKDEELEVAREPLPEMPAELAELLKE